MGDEACQGIEPTFLFQLTLLMAVLLRQGASEGPTMVTESPCNRVRMHESSSQEGVGPSKGQGAQRHLW